MVVVVVGGDSRNETPSIFRKEKSPVRAERIDAFVILFFFYFCWDALERLRTGQACAPDSG